MSAPRRNGPKKGERFGGRAKGTPNKRTTERLEQERIAAQAQAEVNKARAANTKLGKDVLEEFMVVFTGMAATYQPPPPGAPAKATADEKKFLQYAELAVHCAGKLAEFQSPKFKAIALMAPPPNNQPKLPAPGDNAKVIDDPHAMARLYQKTIKQVEV